MPDNTRKLAKTAYEGYCEYTDHTSIITGDKLPEWDNLPMAIQLAWEKAIKKVLEEKGEKLCVDQNVL